MLVKGHEPPQPNRTGFYKSFGNLGFMPRLFGIEWQLLAVAATRSLPRTEESMATPCSVKA